MENQIVEKYLEEASMKGSVYGLDTMRELMHRLGDPQDDLHTIHIAGTNGKGAVSTYLSSVIGQKMKVGRYISPVVFRKGEMVQWEQYGEKHEFTKDEYASVMNTVVEKAMEMEQDGLEGPTFFELETAFAFCLLKQWKCEFAIIEVGLGGALDATNIINKPMVTIVTSIGMDHMGILGDRIEDIVEAKAGIAKTKVPMFLNVRNRTIRNMLEKEVRKRKGKIIASYRYKPEILKASLKGTKFLYRGTVYETQMPGNFQVENAKIAIDVCKYFGFTNIYEGIRDAFWPGRFQVLQKEPLVILDGAHNEEGAAVLGSTIGRLLNTYSSITGVMAVFKDKDYEKIASYVVPWCDKMVVTKAKGMRSLDPNELAKVCAEMCQDVTIVPAPKEAFAKACQMTEPTGAIVVFGTLSIMGDIVS